MTVVALDSLVASIAHLEDAVGVLSVYVGVDPAAEAAARPAWEIELDDALGAIRHNLKARHDRVAFGRCLGDLAPALARLVDASEHGRGRALFVAVESGETHGITVQPALPTGATLGGVAHLVPLLAVDEGAPQGLVLVGRNVVRALETRLGAVDELASSDVEPVVANGPERKGPAAPNPFRAQQVVSQRERYERHIEIGHRRLLEEAGGAVSLLAAERDWELAVVAGDPRGGGLIADALRRHGVETEVVDRDLETLRPAQALQELGPVLAGARHRRDLALVQRARDAALSGGRGALGLALTLTALDEGRVDCLLLDPAVPVASGLGPPGAAES